MISAQWKGQWAVVTGASSGIGQALAEVLAAEGVNLVLTARRLDRLEQLAARLPVQTHLFAADLTEPDAPRQIHAFTESKFIEPALLINNAGFGVFGEFREMDL